MAEVKYGEVDRSDGKKIEENIKNEWQLADSLSAVNSPLRINLYGKERIMGKPIISTAVDHEPWAMGSNPNRGR
ncbi:hypothetical protein [Rahnella woolbedingensis]|nr:hypothetical protein [Rahnella woolbedingensis]